MLSSQRALVKNSVNYIGTSAGYCGLGPCQAISWVAAGVSFVVFDEHGGVVGNYGALFANFFLESRLKMLPVPSSKLERTSDIIQGEISRNLSEHVNGNTQ